MLPRPPVVPTEVPPGRRAGGPILRPMSDLLASALRGASAAAPPGAGAARVLVVGAAGPLGAAVLEQLLARGGFSAVGVSTVQPMRPVPVALTPLSWDDPQALARFGAETAVVVLDAPRGSGDREAVMHAPPPQALPEVARRLHAAGVRHLLVVLPHDGAGLPAALQAGLANLDEQAVAALGWRHVLFVRPAQAPAAVAAAEPLHRLARLMLSQLRFMVPQRERPVRAQKVAAFVAALAAGVPEAPAGTRVVPAERVWQASQQDDPAPLARAWLAGGPLPELHEPAARW